MRHLRDVEAVVAARRGGHRLPPASGRHLADCRVCKADVRDFKTLSAQYLDAANEPQAGALARAWSLIGPKPPRRADLGRFEIAKLIRDTTSDGAVGLRAAAAQRAQFWRARRVDVDLRMDPGGLGSAPMLIGQLLPRHQRFGASHGIVWLWESNRQPRWSSLTTAGEFVLPAPRGKKWKLCIEWGLIRLRLEVP